jgi:hypothetical protein
MNAASIAIAATIGSAMPNYVAQDCPLCGRAAQFYWVDAGNRKYFRCATCTYFQISRRAEEILADASQQRRDDYAAQAPRAPDDQMLDIRMPEAEFRKTSTDRLQATFVPKAELPLS